MHFHSSRYMVHKGNLLVFGARSMGGACTFIVRVTWCIKGTCWCLVQGACMERTLSKCRYKVHWGILLVFGAKSLNGA